MRPKKMLIAVLTLSTVLVLPIVASAQTEGVFDTNDFTSGMGGITESTADFLAESLGGMSYLGDPVGYATVRHLAIGVAGGAVLVPIKNLTIPEGTAIDIDFGDLTYIPIPVVGAYAKIAFKRLELGAKLAGFPTYEQDPISVQNMIVGGKVRYRLAGFNLSMIKGGVSVGALAEYMKGNLDITQKDGFPIDGSDVDSGDPTVNEQIAGQTIGYVTTEAGIQNSWSAITFGGEAQANFQVLFLNFFTGARVSKTSGSAKSEFSGTVTFIEEPEFAEYELIDTSVNNETITPISNETKASGIDIYGFGGLEVKILILTVTARGSYNFSNEVLSVDGGVRLQF